MGTLFYFYNLRESTVLERSTGYGAYLKLILGYSLLFLQKNIGCDPSFVKAVLMRGHNLCFV